MKAGFQSETQFDLLKKPVFWESTSVEQKSHFLCPGVYSLVYLIVLKDWNGCSIILEVLRPVIGNYLLKLKCILLFK